MNLRKTLFTPQARRCSTAAVAAAAAALLLAPGTAFASGQPAGPERPAGVGHTAGAADDVGADGSEAGHSMSGHSTSGHSGSGHSKSGRAGHAGHDGHAGHAGHADGKKPAHKKGRATHHPMQHAGDHATRHTTSHETSHRAGHGTTHAPSSHATSHAASPGVSHGPSHAPSSAKPGMHHPQGAMHRAVDESGTSTSSSTDAGGGAKPRSNSPDQQPPKPSGTPKPPKPGNQKHPSDTKKSPPSGPMATVTKLSMSKNLTSARAVTMSAHVSPAHRTTGAPPETGTINFTVDGSSSGPIPLTNKRASVKVKLTPGNHTATAKYSGDSAHSPSDSGPTTFTVS